MKKIFTVFIVLCSLAVSAMAVTVNDVAGVFKGDLNIGGDEYPNKEIYILPGKQANTITFVLPDFKFGAASLGDIVLVNMPMDANGRLTLENATLYIRAIQERATISVINGLQDGGVTYNSDVTASSAQVLLSIAAPSLNEPIFVLFVGTKVTNENYAVTNGGFEGNWSNNEAPNWHSFPTATGDYASFVTGNTQQFQQSTDIRPGSTGSHSAFLQSNMVLSAKANGNCTNGRINAGATTADSPANNYNFSDPSSSGYNTPFVGNPDSIVFWAKYIPADKNPSNSVNKARTSVAITTNARYQDPESSDAHTNAKIASAAINYSATSDMGWQRLSVPFAYTSVDPTKAAYVLVTFTTNETPGGGSTYSSGGLFNKTYYYDNLYIDDVEMIYNHALSSLTMDGKAVSFTNGQATSAHTYSDSDYAFVATSNGKASKSFIGYDETNNQVHVYVVADNYSQARAYSIYTLQMAEPVRDTYYEYAASTCDNEPYSDELFARLTKAGTYTTTIPNAAGHDSIITLTLSVLPTYSFATTATIDMDETYTWRDHTYADLTPGVHTFKDELQTKAGCDSIYTLTLTVKAIAYSFDEEQTVCQNEEATWHEKVLPTAQAGTVIVYDSLKSVYNTDSVYRLELTVLPAYAFSEEQTIDMGETYTWRGHTYENLTPGVYTYKDEFQTQAGCDSIYILTLTVNAIAYWFNEEQTVCQNEEATWHEKVLPTAQAGTVIVYDSLKSVYNTDSVYRLELTVLPAYAFSEEQTIDMGETYTWRDHTYADLTPGVHTYKDEFQTQAGCDSIYILTLTVNAIAYSFDEEQTVCQREEATWHGKALPTAQAGTVIVYDSLKSVYNTDSVYRLELTVLPSWQSEETKYVNDPDFVWHGKTIQGLAQSSDPYFFYDSLTAVNGCDSVYVLRLYVSDVPITYGEYDAVICDGDWVTFDGVRYTQPFDGEIRVSKPNIYGGDSIVHLTVTVLPSYTIDEYMTIIVGEEQYWEGWNLSTMPEGETELYATYYTDDDCDSTLILHLTVNAEPIESAIPNVPMNGKRVQKIIWNGHLYIIREDETIYDILGTKIK